MERAEKAIFTNMCMICDGRGNVLVQDRVDPDWPGVAFPGGHVEKGESFTDAVVREVREETGLTVSALALCGVKDWTKDDGTRYVVLLYRANRFEGTPVSSREGEVRWVPLNALDELPLASGMRATLQVFLSDRWTEQFFFRKDGKWSETILK